MRVSRYPVMRAGMALMIALVACGVHFAEAKDQWPIKPVELVNPFAAGGAADIQARKLAEMMSKELGEAMVVRNVTGAGGAIAYNKVQKEKPDGYTLIWLSGAVLTLAANKQTPFDYHAFDLICGIGGETAAIAVKKDSSWKDLKEFLV